jgi:hypothetical protein
MYVPQMEVYVLVYLNQISLHERLRDQFLFLQDIFN